MKKGKTIVVIAIIITTLLLIVSSTILLITYIDYRSNKNKLDTLNNNITKVEVENKELEKKVSSIYKDNDDYTKKVNELEIWKKELTKVKR